MFCIELRMNAPIVRDLVPEYFLQDSDMLRVLQDRSLYEKLVYTLGEGKLLGRLGVPDKNDIYFESIPQKLDYDVGDKESLGYYEAL